MEQEKKQPPKSDKQALMETEWSFRAWALLILGPVGMIAVLVAAVLGEITIVQGIGYSLIFALLGVIGWGMRRMK